MCQIYLLSLFLLHAYRAPRALLLFNYTRWDKTVCSEQPANFYRLLLLRWAAMGLYRWTGGLFSLWQASSGLFFFVVRNPLKLALFSFLYLKKQNFKNICRIVKFSKMGACRPRRPSSGRQSTCRPIRRATGTHFWKFPYSAYIFEILFF